QSLEILNNPVIIAVAGVLYFLEFFADKIPWIDSAWDAVHTIIRPVGGALLGLQVLGHSSPTFDIVVLMLAGGTSLVAHTAKASTRLVANTSPEPFSNIGLSLAEDAAVFGGLALIHFNPVIAFAVFLLALLALLYFAPKILRAMKAKIWLVFKKLNGPAEAGSPAHMPTTLPTGLAPIFQHHNVLQETIAWAVPCLSGRGRRIPANLFGVLVATQEEPGKLVFVAKKGRGLAQTIDLEGMTVAREPKFLSENLVIFPDTGKGPRYLFVFPRSSGAAVEEIAESLRTRLPPPETALSEATAEPALHA
ncbi:MAG: DUF4126 domain-containing protein, partial [Chthoniobacterales bacterium]